MRSLLLVCVLLTHPHLCRCADGVILSELVRTQGTLRALTGREARLFRPPFGEYEARTVRIGRTLGLRLVEYVVRRARNGSIVVFHMNGRGWHTAEALPAIIARLRKNGLRLVRVGDLLAHSPISSHPTSGGTRARP